MSPSGEAPWAFELGAGASASAVLHGVAASTRSVKVSQIPIVTVEQVWGCKWLVKRELGR